MKKVILDFDTFKFRAIDAEYKVEDVPGQPYTVTDDCIGSFVVYNANGNYFGCTVDFDDIELPLDWEEIEEEVISQINLEYR